MKIKKISHYKNTLGEGAWWNETLQLLYWTDIIEGKLYTYDPYTKIETYKKFNGSLGCFAPCKNGNFLIGLNLSFYIYNPHLDTLTKFVDLLDEPKENRINDGTTDPYGRFWVGTMTSENYTKKQNGSLYCLNPNGQVTKFLDCIYTPNGLAFNKSGTKMYFSDTGKIVQTIWQFDYDLKTGNPINKKVFATTKDLKGRPDGATVDIDECYWMAGVEGSELVRFNENGEIINIFKLPVEKPTKPVFGNYNLNTIYLTSIGKGYEDSEVPNLNGYTLEISGHNFKGFGLTHFNF